MQAYRYELGHVEPPADFWRNNAPLSERIDLARQLDPLFAEAVNALGAVWNILLRELPGQQAAALLIVHTRGTATSADVATALNVSQQAASNVLKRLTEKRILASEKKGRTPHYRVAHLWPMGRVASAAQIVVRRLLPGVTLTSATGDRPSGRHQEETRAGEQGGQSECVCGETSTRNCPVHGQGVASGVPDARSGGKPR